jgi:hypothetical protein
VLKLLEKSSRRLPLSGHMLTFEEAIVTNAEAMVGCFDGGGGEMLYRRGWR